MWVVGGFSKNVKPHKLHGRRIADKGGNKEMASWSKALLSFRLEPHPSVPSSSTPRLSFCSNSFSSSPSFIRYSLFFAFKTSAVIKLNNSSAYPLITSRKPTPFSPSFSSTKFVCKAAEYKFPDPIPEFADAETDKFRTHLLNKLSKKDIFGDSVEEVVGICTQSLHSRSDNAWTPRPVISNPLSIKDSVNPNSGRYASRKHLVSYGSYINDVASDCSKHKQIFSTFLRTEYGGPGMLLVIPFIDMADTLNERGLPGGPQAARAAVKWAQDHVDKDWKEWTGSN
ncbi:hypothetical protein SCA6_007416 [Theobroma cacao]